MLLIHSSEIRGLCSMKCSNEYEKTHAVFYPITLHATLLYFLYEFLVLWLRVGHS